MFLFCGSLTSFTVCPASIFSRRLFSSSSAAFLFFRSAKAILRITSESDGDASLKVLMNQAL